MLSKFKSTNQSNLSSSTVKPDPASFETKEMYKYEVENSTIDKLTLSQFESLTANFFTENRTYNILMKKYESMYINACIDANIDEYFEASLFNISREIYSKLGSVYFMELITTIHNENIKNTTITKNLLNSLKEFSFEEMGRRVNSFFLHHLINKDEEQVITVISIIENWGSKEELDFLNQIKESTIKLSDRAQSYLERVMSKLA